MADLKTTRNTKSVSAFIDSVKDEARRKDARRMLQLMRRATGERPAMWGPSIVGFGTYHYVYSSGREGDWMLTGFSPRKKSLTIYIMSGFARHSALMRSLGNHRTGASCLYIRRLDEVDLKVLERLIRESVQVIKRKNRRDT